MAGTRGAAGRRGRIGWGWGRDSGRTVAVDVGLANHALDLVVGDGVESESAHHRLQFGRLDSAVFVAVEHPERAADLCHITS